MAGYHSDSDSGRSSSEESEYDSRSGRSFSEESEYNSGDDYTETKQVGNKRKRGTNNTGGPQRKAKAAPKPTYVARVSATANDGADMSESASKVDKADSNILARIRKAMQLATHPGTGEAEAKVAMRMATKLMQSQNLTQADLIANETAEERSTRAGHSTVTITSTQNKMVKRSRWYNTAASAACEAFDVQVYSSSQDDYESLDWVFYGLADNTVAAALAFEMLYNQIETWAIERKGELKGRSAPNSYRIGVARRVLEDAERENKQAMKKAEEEEKKRIKEETLAAEAARAAEIARLVTPVIAEPPPTSLTPKEKPNAPKIEDVPDDDDRKASAYPSDDEDSNDPPPSFEDGAIMSDADDDLRADFDDQDDDAGDLDLDALEQKIKVKSEQLDPPLTTHHCSTMPTTAPTVKPEPDEPTIKSEPSDDAAPSWTSALQLRKFRDNAKDIAKTYIKDAGLKLRSAGKLPPIKYDRAAYNKGWDDGQKVHLKRRRIEDEEKIKKER